MPAQEPDDLPGDLQPGHVRVQKQPIDTLHERHIALEHVVDVRHAGHRSSMNAKGGLCPPAYPTCSGGGREGGLTLPLIGSF